MEKDKPNERPDIHPNEQPDIKPEKVPEKEIPTEPNKTPEEIPGIPHEFPDTGIKKPDEMHKEMGVTDSSYWY